MSRTPNTYSPEEVRKAIQNIHFDVGIITEGDLGEVLVGAGSGSTPTWTTSLTAITLLTVDNITINGATITSSSGAIGFDNENLTTTGTIAGVNVTSGENPGHTHTGSSLSGIDISSDTNLSATAPIVLTGDILSLTQSGIDHGSIGGLGDDDHTQYSLVAGTRAFNGVVGGVTPTLATHLATKGYVDESEYRAGVADDAIIAGNALYVSSTGHVDLAHADLIAECNALGIAIEAKALGASVRYITHGPITIADWTALVGAATLTAGANYYLKESTSSYGTPSYVNEGGTGDRGAIITFSRSDIGYAGSDFIFLDGAFLYYFAFYNATPVSGHYLKFDFGVGADKLITEAKWYQDDTKANGTWQWQGSNNNVDWTSIGSTFTLGGAATQTQTELSGNTIGYRYYQLLGVSGNTGTLVYAREIEFKIAGLIPGAEGILTETPVTTTGSYVVKIGRATTTTTLDINISEPYLLR